MDDNLKTRLSIVYTSMNKFEIWLNFTEVCAQGPIANKTPMVLVMARRRTGDKQLPEPVLTTMLTS